MSGEPVQVTSVTSHGTTATWFCHECGAGATVSNVLAGELAATDHWDHHCPSTYAHRDQPDHQEDE